MLQRNSGACSYAVLEGWAAAVLGPDDAGMPVTSYSCKDGKGFTRMKRKIWLIHHRAEDY